MPLATSLNLTSDENDTINYLPVNYLPFFWYRGWKNATEKESFGTPPGRFYNHTFTSYILEGKSKDGTVYSAEFEISESGIYILEMKEKSDGLLSSPSILLLVVLVVIVAVLIVAKKKGTLSGVKLKKMKLSRPKMPEMPKLKALKLKLPGRNKKSSE